MKKSTLALKHRRTSSLEWPIVHNLKKTIAERSRMKKTFVLRLQNNQAFRGYWKVGTNKLTNSGLQIISYQIKKEAPIDGGTERS